MDIINHWCFKAGAVCLLLAVGFYSEAHLRFGDPDTEPLSDRACGIFWGILAALFFFGLALEAAQHW